MSEINTAKKKVLPKYTTISSELNTGLRNFFLFSLCIAEVLLLFWGVWLCLRVRNAPSAYNESKYFAWCIYNTVFIMILVGLLRLVILYTYYIHHCAEASPSSLFKVVSKYSYINRKAILSYIYPNGTDIPFGFLSELFWTTFTTPTCRTLWTFSPLMSWRQSCSFCCLHQR